MKYEIVELEEFSGRKATIYSVILGNDDVTLLDYFVQENSIGFKDEVDDIMNNLEEISNLTGAVRERSFFNLMKEGLVMVYVPCMICLTVIYACIVSDMERLKTGEMRWSYDGSKLLGNLNISENEE